MSLFLVMFGGWAIGMRNMIIYELDADYSRYLESLGAPHGLVRRYAYRNALLPQVTGLALSLGVIVAGALVTEIVFALPRARQAAAGSGPEPGLLPAPGDLPVRHHRRPDRQLPRRHRLRRRRSADPGRDERRRARDERDRGRHRRRSPARVRQPPCARSSTSRLAPPQDPGRRGAIHRLPASWASRSSARSSGPATRTPSSARSPRPPDSTYWFGTTTFGQDVFAQFVHGLRATFLVGFLGGSIAAHHRHDRRASWPATAAGSSTRSST